MLKACDQLFPLENYCLSKFNSCTYNSLLDRVVYGLKTLCYVWLTQCLLNFKQP